MIKVKPHLRRRINDKCESGCGFSDARMLQLRQVRQVGSPKEERRGTLVVGLLVAYVEEPIRQGELQSAIPAIDMDIFVAFGLYKDPTFVRVEQILCPYYN